MAAPAVWSTYTFFEADTLAGAQFICNVQAYAAGQHFVSLTKEQVWNASLGRLDTGYLLVMGK